EDSCSSVLFKALAVRVSSFSASRDGMLFRIPIGIVVLLKSEWSRLLGTVSAPSISAEFPSHCIAYGTRITSACPSALVLIALARPFRSTSERCSPLVTTVLRAPNQCNPGLRRYLLLEACILAE